VVHHQTLTTTKGPLLITANHPNSFLDAIIIGALFQQPVHFLARGDAFKKPWHRWLLEQLHMIPASMVRIFTNQ
jgi:1-acyl-sn-glycerol-3-phosphate acyltransferase